MGTRFEIVIPGISEDEGDTLFSLINRELFRIENMLSNYEKSSALSRLNANATLKPTNTQPELFDLVVKLKEFNKITRGYFDPCLLGNPGIQSGPDIYTDSPFAGGGIASVLLDMENQTISYTNDHVCINSGGFGKGYALDKLKTILLQNRVSNAFISFGESSVLTLGNHPYGKSWSISIPHFFSDKSVYSVDLVNTSVSISGNSPANNKKYQKGHILNPKTGNFIDKMAMVCVTGPSAFLAEILSTALFAQGDEIQQDIISDFEGYNAVFIDYTQSSTQPIIMEIEKSGYNVK